MMNSSAQVGRQTKTPKGGRNLSQRARGDFVWEQGGIPGLNILTRSARRTRRQDASAFERQFHMTETGTPIPTSPSSPPTPGTAEQSAARWARVAAASPGFFESRGAKTGILTATTPASGTNNRVQGFRAMSAPPGLRFGAGGGAGGGPSEDGMDPYSRELLKATDELLAQGGDASTTDDPSSSS